MATIDVKDASGAVVPIEKPLAAGRAAATASRPVVLSNEDAALIDGLETLITSSNTKLDTLHADLATTLVGLLDGLEGILGVTSGTAVVTDANGTVQQYLRGLVKRWVDALGTGTAAAALRTTLATDVGLPAGTALLGKVKTKFIEAVAATMTRPNDTNAYAANDAVANSTTAGSVTPFSFSMSDVNDDLVTIERLRLITTDTGVAGKALRMWLFRASPTVAAGDNAAFSNPRATFIGSLSGTMRTFSDGSGGIFVPDEGSRIITLPTSGAKTVFGLLQTLEAIASPLAQSTWIATLEGFQGSA
ncbi:hypothetical protein EN829_015100 [Mesorhizobium sp. M00.F.Ca.ET.186.01.1.1]|nr:hypothetical protein EN848_14335 [bacterium M00.F.Ca.ET.205.01.1.1]TGU53008.1 hypothetical protein EN795_15060 [bacterium M00.F.Ca.ET.152.01.1.1]TGV35977.1 hypothetical protein EN829_015100 [Mesorhizobium sp. M00.F.Ca.ET.186.01.1.1]TGZ43560.1 hypothetical protein EN805_10670 [bacterium M00.F.Ca.ET.162.01.1.1]